MAFDPISYINEPRWQESRLGLERIRLLLDRLGRPQDRLKFVHVAGTNGKGSTCAFLASVLQTAGYRTGLFTSPYIEAFEERIRVNGANIASDDLLEATLEVKEAAEAVERETGDHPTEFELMTAVALVHFARKQCEIVVLEVGLGGRLDSTNAIDAPEVTVISRIGLDHTALLGSTLAAIAGEKAGIIKPGSPVVSWAQDPEAMDVIAHAATSAGDSLRIVDPCALMVGDVHDIADGDEALAEPSLACETCSEIADRKPYPAPDAHHGTCAEVEETPETHAEAVPHPSSRLARSFSYGDYADLETGLLGSYQPANAALAIETIEALRERGWKISDDALRSGIARTTWPGRFEVVESGKGKPTIVVDGGHNPQGAAALMESLESVFPGRRPVFVIGVLADKDYPAMLEAVMPLAFRFITVTPPNPRALSAEALARAIRWTGQDMLGCSAHARPYAARDIDDAVRHARDLAGSEGLICAFGSLYSIGALKAAVAETARAIEVAETAVHD